VPIINCTAFTEFVTVSSIFDHLLPIKNSTYAPHTNVTLYQNLVSFHINHHYIISFSLHFTIKKTALNPKVEIFSDQLQPGVFASAQLFLTV